MLINASPSDGSLILNISSSGSIGEFMSFNFSSSDIMPDSNISLYVNMENGSFSSSVNALVELSWAEGNITQLVVDVKLGLMLSHDNKTYLLQ